MKTVDPQTALGWLQSGEAILIDVREHDEFKSQHIPYALSMPLSNVCAAFRMLALAPNAYKKIIFQCNKGGRGGQACIMVGAELGGGKMTPQTCRKFIIWRAALPLG